jgi:cytochrome oxidase Cu insertion factor (SCO1/SenC/PrrC family)
LPVLGTVPDFALTERSGRVVTKADLGGRPWVANFIFTTCAGVCPLLSNRMAALRRDLAARGLMVRSVSFSVDPARDTPHVLRDYAARYTADQHAWLFLTGPHEQLYGLISDGFHLSVAERSAAEAAQSPGELITHSDRFVLVDADGQIRAYYHGTDAEVVAQVLRDVATL